MKMKKVIATVSIASLLSLSLIGCGDTSTTDTEDSETTEVDGEQEQVDKEEEVKDEYAVGETIESDGMELTVTGVEKSQGGEYDNPKEGSEYVIVTVQYDNSSEKDLPYNPFDFKLLNGDGQKTDSTFTMDTQDTRLESGDLAPGGTVTGDLVFEAPAGDEGLYLIYTGNIFKTDGIKIKL